MYLASETLAYRYATKWLELGMRQRAEKSRLQGVLSGGNELEAVRLASPSVRREC